MTWFGRFLMDWALALNAIRVRVFAFTLVVLGGAMQVLSCFCHDPALSQSVSKGGYLLVGGGLGLLKATDDDHPLPPPPGTVNMTGTALQPQPPLIPAPPQPEHATSTVEGAIK